MFPYYKDNENEFSFQMQRLRNVKCSSNCHFAIEAVIVLDGLLTVKLDDRIYNLRSNEVMLIMPYQIHSFATPTESESIILNISKDIFPDNKMIYETEKPAEPVLKIPKVDFLYITEHLNTIDVNDIVSLYCVFYAIFNLYFKNTYFVHKEGPNDLYGRAIDYTSRHFGENITIKDMAKALHVNHVYLSRVFNMYSDTNFRTFLNGFRAERATTLLKNTDTRITEIAYECGFCSLRNFNRVFKNLYYCTPKEYRSKEKKAINKSIK